MTYRELALIILNLKDNHLDQDILVHMPSDDAYYELADFPLMKSCIDHNVLEENQLYLTLQAFNEE